MKKIWSVSLILVLAGIVSCSLWLYWTLKPSNHFSLAAKPLLTVPNPPRTEDADGSAPADGSATPDSRTTGSASDVSQQDADTRSFNVVLVGTDTWGDDRSRADTIMVAHVLPTERKANIVSIPRDTRVYVQGVGYTKINHAHIVGEMQGGNRQGTQLLIQSISDFLGIPIHYYVKTNFTGVKDFIDTIGGVDVEVEEDVEITPNIIIKKGSQHLDGEHALFLARQRYSVPGGDFGRQTEQYKIVKAAVRQLLKPDILPQLPALLKKAKKDIVDTNFNDSDLISLAWLFKGMNGDDFRYAQIPGRDGYSQDPLVGDKVYYWLADMDQVKKIVQQYLNN